MKNRIINIVIFAVGDNELNRQERQLYPGAGSESTVAANGG